MSTQHCREVINQLVFSLCLYDWVCLYNYDKRSAILLIDDSLNVGGKERLLLSALRGLSRNAFSVHLCVLGNQGELGRKAIELSDSYCLGRRKSPLSLYSIMKLRRYITKNRIDLVHCNGVIDAVYVWIATYRINIVKLCTIHGHEHGWRGALHRFVLRSFDGIISVSLSFLVDLVKLGYCAKRFFVVANCHSVNACDKMRDRRRDNVFKIVCVSRFDWSKDHMTILRACKILIDNGIRVSIDLIGDGDECYKKPIVDTVVQLHLEHHVRLLGTVLNVTDCLREYDLFVLSSFSESFGIAIIEAMAMGLPVMVSDIPPFREIIGDGEYGFAFKPGNAQTLADSIELVYYNENLLKDMKVKSYERARYYSEEKYCMELQTVYQNILSGKYSTIPVSSKRTSIGKVIDYVAAQRL